jgi:hypothetical protein
MAKRKMLQSSPSPLGRGAPEGEFVHSAHPASYLSLGGEVGPKGRVRGPCS